MATEKQIEANRRNAQQSTGPNTAEGKLRSRLNGLVHGLRTRCVDVLPNEDPDEFANRVSVWVYEMQPSSDVEEFLVRQAAILSWKIDRADRYERARLSRPVAEALAADDDDGLAADLASFDPGNEGERIRRYQFSLQRALDRVLARLAKIRADESKGLWGRVELDEEESTEDAREEEFVEDEAPAVAGPGFATSGPDFEEELRAAADRLSPSEADFAAVPPVSFAAVPNRPLNPGVKPGRAGLDAFEYLDISCLRS